MFLSTLINLSFDFCHILVNEQQPKDIFQVYHQSHPRTHNTAFIMHNMLVH